MLQFRIRQRLLFVCCHVMLHIVAFDPELPLSFKASDWKRLLVQTAISNVRHWLVFSFFLLHEPATGMWLTGHALPACYKCRSCFYLQPQLWTGDRSLWKEDLTSISLQWDWNYLKPVTLPALTDLILDSDQLSSVLRCLSSCVQTDVKRRRKCCLPHL